MKEQTAMPELPEPINVMHLADEHGCGAMCYPAELIRERDAMWMEKLNATIQASRQQAEPFAWFYTESREGTYGGTWEFFTREKEVAFRDDVDKGSQVELFTAPPAQAQQQEAAQAVGVEQDKVDAERAKIIREALAHVGGKWPEELLSGVMFFKGERITKIEFDAARAAKEKA